MASADFSQFVVTARLSVRLRDLSSYGRTLSTLCPPHLHRPFRIAIGLWCLLPPHPRPYALYVVSVRQARCLPPTSFRFRLATDTLAFGCTLPAIRARWGLSPVRVLSCWTNNKKGRNLCPFVAREEPFRVSSYAAKIRLIFYLASIFKKNLP